MLIVIFFFFKKKKWCSDGNAKTGLAELNRKCHRDPSCSVALSALLCEVLIAELVVVGKCQTGFIFNLQRLPKKKPLPVRRLFNLSHIHASLINTFILTAPSRHSCASGSGSHLAAHVQFSSDFAEQSLSTASCLLNRVISGHRHEAGDVTHCLFF